MKRLISLIAVLAFVSLSYGQVTQSVGIASQYKSGNDNSAIRLHTRNTALALDTFATGAAKLYGPYSLTSADNGPQFSGMNTYADIITGTTATMSLDYALLPGDALADTTGVWVAQDTLTTTAQEKYVAFTSKAAKSIVFRINNYDGTACQIPADLWIVFDNAITHERRR